MKHMSLNEKMRDSTKRCMKDVKSKESSMHYPYSWVPEYGLKQIRRPILVETDAADAGSFPETVHRHLWIRPGEKDGDKWMAIGELNNGAYFFYRGGCDYTGFDCQGGMDLWVTHSWQNLLDYALDEETFRLFQEQTEAI